MSESGRVRPHLAGRRQRWVVTATVAVALFAALIVVLGLSPELWVDHPDRKSGSAVWRISTALADTSLVLLAITMMQGPVRVLKGGEPAVHLPWRRSFGVAAAVTAAIHVGFGLSIHADLLRPWSGFVTGVPTLSDPFPILGGARGYANYLGIAALAGLAVLAGTSNKAMMRYLRRRWKPVQRLSYLVGGVVLGHVLLYQDVEQRLFAHRALVLGVIGLAMVAQLVGWLVVSGRRRSIVRNPNRNAAVETPTRR